MDGYEIVQAKHLVVGDRLLQPVSQDLYIWKTVKLGTYYFTWVSKTQSLVFFGDEWVYRAIGESGPQELQRL